MIKIFYHSVCLCIVLVLSSCYGGKNKMGTFNFGSPQKNLYASYFRIYKDKDFSVLVTYLNAAGTDSAVYVLYKKNKPEFDFRAYYVKTPVQKVATFSSVFVGFISRLGIVEKIIAVDNLDFISNAMVQYLAAEGSIKELSKTGQLNMEQMLKSGAEILMTNPSGDPKKDFDKRLTDAGVTPVVCADYFENHPLGRAEWIKAIALFFNKENEADSVFNSVRTNYAALKNSVDTCKYKPTVFTEKKTNDVWFVAGGKSSAAQFINDAGADYLWKDNNKTDATALSMEQVLQKAANADYWINLHLCNSAEELLKQDSRYGEFSAFKKGNLYNNNAIVTARGANDYWESGLCSPDKILQDLIKIFHPELQPGHQLKYYKQLK
ncbi:MAG: ABC transporter substrate-binding protein [Bacteroidia bacterium]